MRVVCFGDSNTYGCDPRSCFGGRYGAETRWVDCLARQTGWEVVNAGENGREIPRTPTALPSGDLLIVMLGTNDLLQGASPQETAHRMEAFLQSLKGSRIFLIAPPPLMPGAWVSEERLLESSAQLAALYENLARKAGIPFADAGDWGVELAFDGVHFSAAGHRAFAHGLLNALGRKGASHENQP